MDTEFNVAIGVVESATLDLDNSKIAYKDELKKGEGDDYPQMAVGADKATPGKAKRPKKEDG